MTEGIRLPNKEKIKRTLGEKKTCIYLVILEADHIKQFEMKETFKKSISGEWKYHSKPNYEAGFFYKTNKYPRSPLVRYSGHFLKCTREDLKQMDQRMRILMTMHWVLHLRDGIDRRYVSRKEGERGLASIEDIIDASIQWLEDYTDKRRERLITATRAILTTQGLAERK